VSLEEQFRLADLRINYAEEYHIENHPWARRPATLIVKARPTSGWVTLAEHGSLAVRRGEHYIHPIIGCHSKCTYCYLLSASSGRLPLRLHVALDELIQEIKACVSEAGRQKTVFCSGELADSLADAPVFPVASFLAERFGRADLGLLELRTKSNRVETLLDVQHNNHTIVAFSISPETHVKKYEAGTASLGERIEAAVTVAQVGYRIAFKFEPVFLDDGWPEAYSMLFSRIATALRGFQIDHISIGCLRWSQQLAHHPIFVRHHSKEVSEGTLIEYRPNRFNGTIKRDQRIPAYRLLRHLARQAGLITPLWWSLEEEDVIEELNST
jgi:DNA repair photolyase